MTPIELQKALCKEIELLLDNHLFTGKEESGKVIEKKINVYAQNLPMINSDEDEGVLNPYVIVRIVDGETDMDGAAPYTISMVLIASVYDKAEANNGHEQIQLIFDSIYERFAKDPMLNNMYYCSGHMKWTHQDDSYYPYSFGAMRIDFTIPAIRRESDFT